MIISKYAQKLYKKIKKALILIWRNNIIREIIADGGI